MAMTDAEKRAMVCTLIGESLTDTVADVYLSLAKDKIMARRFPFGTDETAIPTEYEILQCELAERLYLRKGAEGEISHNENGINREYDSVNDSDLLSRIVPFAKLG